MIVNPLTLEQAIQKLNELLVIDQKAITFLMDTRVLCSTELANYPDVQTVGVHMGDSYARYEVGVLGILNALFGSYSEGEREGWGPICAVYDNGNLIRFEITPNK